MHYQEDIHTESALYWSAVSLIVCEGLSVGEAAQRLGIENGRLRNILRRRVSPIHDTCGEREVEPAALRGHWHNRPATGSTECQAAADSFW
jgi:predicted HTH domain antitoxin